MWADLGVQTEIGLFRLHIDMKRRRLLKNEYTVLGTITVVDISTDKFP